MTLKKNDDIRLEITTLTNQGSGLGRFNDEVVFVDSAVPGDILDVHIIKVSKNYAIGKINKVIKPSKNRIVSDCDVSTRCGGCAYRHMKYDAELLEKKKYVGDVLQRIGGVAVQPEEILSIEKPEAYRNKALIPVGLDEKGNVVTGFYSRKTHRIIDCDNCKLQMEEFSPIIKAVKRYILENPVTIYDEKTHKGLIRHIYLRRGRNTGDIMVCLVVNGDNIPSKQKLIDLLTATDENIKSIVLNVNREKTNVVLGTKTITLWGEDTIEDILCGLRFRISPLSFYQVNPEGTELLYKRAKEYAEL
ncbi:MAG: 23S rRNA (uracil(1939)-C(5))-methyltransferase RlmD, partial [Clostridia bacterium]|nr:23S rRNA (uracil(1939)-C(5))-methyltransferase RlmD [Clostridia bacterium]